GGNDLASRSQRGLDPGLDAQAFLDGVPGYEPRRDQHARVRRIRATGNRRDHNVAVADVKVLTRDADAAVDFTGPFVFAFERLLEARFAVCKRDPPLRLLRPGERRYDVAEVE